MTTKRKRLSGANAVVATHARGSDPLEHRCRGSLGIGRLASEALVEVGRVCEVPGGAVMAAPCFRCESCQKAHFRESHTVHLGPIP